MVKIVFILLVNLIVVAWTKTANAAYPCPDGPGADERQVGVAPTIGGIAGVRLCEKTGVTPQGNGESQPNQPLFPRSIPKIDTYIAVALHPEANEPWAIWNNPYSEKDAKERVLAACNKAMGGNCVIVGSGKNSSVALGYLGNILTEAALGETPEQAAKNVLTKCSDKGNKCKALIVFTTRPNLDLSTDSSSTYYPTSTNVRLVNTIRQLPEQRMACQWLHGLAVERKCF